MTYAVIKKTIPAAHPRVSVESTSLPGVRLQVVYNKFQYDTASDNKRKFNLIFLHGTGMNKAIWNYYVEQLDKQYNFQLNCLIAFDAVNHCDSHEVNKGKLGKEYMWIDGARDLIEIIRYETENDAEFLKAANIAIGHSLGGFGLLMAGYLEPMLFDSIVAIEPVIYRGKDQSIKSWERMLLALSKVIVTDFKSDDEYIKYMKTLSFYKKFHPQIFNDFVNEERLTHTSGVSAKTTKLSQMSVYVCSANSIPLGASALPYIYVPVLQIVGKEATWNPPGSADIVGELIPYCETVGIPGGAHLLQSELPDDVIDSIVKFIEKRAGVLENSQIYGDPKYKSLVNRWVSPKL